MRLPQTLTIDLNGRFPNEVCFVTDGIGTARGGFRKGFKTHEAMWEWLERHGYAPNADEVPA